MLHALHTGKVKSKKAAAKWAQQVLEPKWASMIDQARKERKGVCFGVKISQRTERSLLHETLAFMKYTVTQILEYRDIVYYP